MGSWPKPDVLQVGKAPVDKWMKGTMFVLKGGPHDGLLVRLYPGNYPDTEVSGWDELPFSEGVRYVRPEGVDPYMQSSAVNKKRSNVPVMLYVD